MWETEDSFLLRVRGGTCMRSRTHARTMQVQVRRVEEVQSGQMAVM